MPAPSFTGLRERLSALSPYEQIVYIHLYLRTENGRLHARFDDLAKQANVSLSTFKRALKKLVARGLVEVTWRQKTPSLFVLRDGAGSAPESGPKWYDRLEPEDRELFLFLKRSIPPTEMRELEQEARGLGLDIDLLIFRRRFGAERQRRYEG